MSRNKSVDYSQYVWEIEVNGQTRYAVAQWVESSGQYQRPLDKGDQELTGCYAEFSRIVDKFGGYKTRKQALRRARYLFGS